MNERPDTEGIDVKVVDPDAPLPPEAGEAPADKPAGTVTDRSSSAVLPGSGITWRGIDGIHRKSLCTPHIPVIGKHQKADLDWSIVCLFWNNSTWPGDF